VYERGDKQPKRDPSKDEKSSQSSRGKIEIKISGPERSRAVERERQSVPHKAESIGNSIDRRSPIEEKKERKWEKTRHGRLG